jgi:two-component system sensor histidine kinase ArlS
MKIRTRITLLFTMFTAGILLMFAAVIYLSARKNREAEFYSLLKREAVTKANLYFNAQVAPQTLQDIYRSNREIIHEVEVAIYDSAFQLLYHDAVDIDYVKETPALIDSVLQGGTVAFEQGPWQVIGMRFEYEGQAYVITAAAYDEYGYRKLSRLRRDMFLVSCLALVVIYWLGRFFSRRAFAPVKEMVDKAKLIGATNLDLRIRLTNQHDEISELAATFNEMLDRLENSFEAQKQFVANIGHELRTPLAAIIAELELAADKARSPAEYRAAVQNTLRDSRKMAKLANSLLDLAKASYDPSEITFRPLRADELLLDACQLVRQANSSYRVDIRFEANFEQEGQVSVNGNEYLLKTAFANLLENGCKFSPNQQCAATISFVPGKVMLKFSDQGVGIAAEDLPHLFTPFYRGANRIHADGNGVGLFLTHKIISLHQGRIEVASTPGAGSTFTVILPTR